MADIINLTERKIEKSPHRTGRARCLACKKEWQCMCPAGVTALVCPECGTNRGVFMALPVTERPQWQCRCGEWVFFIDSEGPYCCNCGVRPDLLNMGR